MPLRWHAACVLRVDGWEAHVLDKVLFGESIPGLRDGMDAAALRQKVIADNIANVATPGYQARRVAFEELLQGNQAASHKLKLARPEQGGIPQPGARASAAAKVEVDTSTDSRSGVNNVDVEREMAAMQRNVLQHAAITQMLAAKYRIIRQAIVDK
jgi:flagellar basal-body rod protein FlgB